MRRITPLITAPTMSTPDTPAPQWAVEAAKAMHNESWHGLSYEQMVGQGAAIIARHAQESKLIWFGRYHKLLAERQPTAPTAQPHLSASEPTEAPPATGCCDHAKASQPPVQTNSYGPIPAHLVGEKIVACFADKQPAATGTPDASSPDSNRPCSVGTSDFHPHAVSGEDSRHTPRTDAQEKLMQGQTFTANAAYAYTFARQLERDLNAARAEVERTRAALHQCYAATGEEAGDADDFRALVDRERITVEAVMEMRRERDRLDAELERMYGQPGSFAERDRLQRELTAMRGLLADIAEQKTTAEIEADDKAMLDDYGSHDFESAYDHIIKLVRARLATERKEDGK